MTGTLGKGAGQSKYWGGQPPTPMPLSGQAPLTSVARQLPADPDIALSGFEAVDGADVVQTPTGHKVP
jgi:hypothetical protein